MTTARYPALVREALTHPHPKEVWRKADEDLKREVDEWLIDTDSDLVTHHEDGRFLSSVDRRPRFMEVIHRLKKGKPV